MFDLSKAVQAVQKNAGWFRQSGVMCPANGEWGVGERIAVMTGNEAAGKICSGFPAYTPYDGYVVIESRRADCNFQTAAMFLLLSECTGNPEDRKTADRILDFLYCRSGLLNRACEDHPLDVWHWSHVWREWYLWIDDNSWCAILQILLGTRYPELNQKYDCIRRGVNLAKVLLNVFRRTYNLNWEVTDDSSPLRDSAKEFWGNLSMPHFGGLLILALILADQTAPEPEFRTAALDYASFFNRNLEKYDSSQLSYLLITMPLAAKFYPQEPLFRTLLDRTARKLRENIQKNPYGNLPAEHHEAPCGPHLADTIYTVNWAFLGMVNLSAYTGKEEDRAAAEKMASMLLKIQDTAQEKQFSGCWRGMYDLAAGTWGGGDCHEGGANSIYTGWTNAPVSIALLLFATGKGLDFLLEKA